MKNKVIEEALYWVGYLEKKTEQKLEDFVANAGNGNYTVFAKLFKDYFGEDYQAQPWCAMFVSCVFKIATGDERLCPHFAYCPTGVNNFKKLGQWHTKPQPGDIIFFTNGTRAYHTGIVISVDNERVYTVEGNTSNSKKVVENGGCVAKKSYALNNSKILGYGRPNYEEVETMKFSDCENHFAKKHIEKLAECGIINGREMDKFCPDETVTRAEAAVMIANALQYAGVIKL